MSHEVRVRISFGLIALAVFHVLLIAGVCFFAHHELPHHDEPAGWTPPAAPLQGSFSKVPSQPIEQSPVVNYAAQSELKQGCAPCNQQPQRVVNSPVRVPQYSTNWSASNPFNLAPGERLLSVGPARVVSPATPDQYLPAQTPAFYAPNYASNDSRPAAKQTQVLLFLDQTARSGQIRNWFATDQNLAKLAANSDFQIYTADHPLYRTRYARLVPPDQFPVVLVQDASGGHIHAAGKQMIPSTSPELVSDIRQAYELYKSAKQGTVQATGMIKTAGYSWDDQISPAMRLQTADCNGPLCIPSQPAASQESLLDQWAKKRKDGGSAVEALFWGGTSDLAAIFVFVIALILAGILFGRRMRN